jgi:hypothetical protein
MKSAYYSPKEFMEVYRDDISTILSIIKSRCDDGNYVLCDKENLFKQVIEYIYQASDRKRLKLV